MSGQSSSTTPRVGDVNMADVAREAGVSLATVSRALRDVPGVSPATRDRIRQIASELAYVVSPEASRLARRDTGRVAIVVARTDVWFYGAMLQAMDEVLREVDLDVLVYLVDGEEQRIRFLRELPVTGVKVDRSFVEGLGRNTRSVRIAETITRLGHALGIPVVAEGVEDAGRLAKLRRLGCQEAQGFLLARPMPAQATVDWLRDRKGSEADVA